MVVVNFGDVELYGLWRLAQDRDAAHARERNQRKDPKTNDVLLNYIGLKGEVATSAVLGGQVNLTTEHATDNGVDLVTCLGSADVKTARRNGPLYVGATKPLRSEILVLVWPIGKTRDPYAGDHPHFWARGCQVVGWIPTAAFVREARLHDWGYGMCRVLPHDRLHLIHSIDDVPNLAYNMTEVA